MSAETMKIPDPIIEPTTIIVESSRPRPLTSSPLAVSTARPMAASAMVSSMLVQPPESTPKLFEARGDVVRGHPPADDRHSVRPGLDGRGGVGGGDAADGHERLARQLARFAQAREADDGLRVRLGRGRKDGPEGHVVHRQRVARLHLRGVVRGPADYLFRAEQRSRRAGGQVVLPEGYARGAGEVVEVVVCLVGAERPSPGAGGQVVLPEVYARGAGELHHVGAVVHNQQRIRGKERKEPARLVQQLTGGGLFGADLNQSNPRPREHSSDFIQRQFWSK